MSSSKDIPLDTRLAETRSPALGRGEDGPLHPARVPRLGHVALVAERPVELAGFYRELFGLQLVRTTDHELGGTMALLSGAPGEEDHELVFLTRPEGAHLALRVRRVADLARLHDRVREREVPVIATLDLGHALSVFIRDPEDNTVELYCAAGRPRRHERRELDLRLTLKMEAPAGIKPPVE